MNWLAFLGIVTLGNVFMIWKICTRINENEKMFYILAKSVEKIALFIDKELKK